jgi:molybdopterin molybdotransferase
MSQPSPSDHDVRMRGFTRRATVDEALAWIDRQAKPLGDETVPLACAAARVLAQDVQSDVDVPGFARAMMDGFAVRAADTMGASAYNRLALMVIGESMPGRPFAGSVGPGEAVRIMTGAPLPDGADAVLPVELVEIQSDHILAQGEVSPEKHVGHRGEDIATGDVALPAGRVLRPQDIGLLASIGVAHVAVVHRPQTRIVVTGDELLPAGSKPEGVKIVDANGPMLRALVERDGGVADHPGIVHDRPEAILDAIRAEADIVLVSGGSSVGQEDHAPELLRQHGELAIHGLAMRPSSPAGMGTLDGRLVFLLPGNPVSCLCAYDFFARRAIRRIAGQSVEWPYRRAMLPLGRKIVSTVGRLDYLRVRVVGGRVEPLAIGGASILSSTTRADGFVLVPPDSEGQPAESVVEVFLYD